MILKLFSAKFTKQPGCSWYFIIPGMVAALGLPPFNSWYLFPSVLLFAGGFSYWFYHTHGRACADKPQLFSLIYRTWYFGFGYFLLSTHWVVSSLRFEEGLWWLAPLGLILIPAIQSIQLVAVTAIIAILTRTWHQPTAPLWRGLMHCGAIPLIELAQYNDILGFPWSQSGMIFSEQLTLLQTTAVVGVHGLSVLANLLGLGVFALIYRQSYRYWLVATAVVSIASCYLGGAQRLRYAPAPLATAQFYRFIETNSPVSEAPLVKSANADEPLNQLSINSPHPIIRIIHPNISQGEKWNSEFINRHFKQFIDLSQHPASPYSAAIDYLLWPEASPFYTLDHHQTAIGLLTAFHTPPQFLITGCVRRQVLTNPTTADFNYIYYNSIIAVDHNHNIVGSYDKVHLVPFGEFIPGRDLIPLPAVAAQSHDYYPGTGPTVIASLPDLHPFSPLVCFDAIFSGDVVPNSNHKQQPAWMLNLTNDAWFTGTIGPAQHFAQVRLRAIEQGLPLVRVANSGTSAIIDSYGRVLARLEADQVGIIDGPLPPPVAEPTLFARYGHKMILVIGVSLMLIAYLSGRFTRKKSAVK